MKKEDKIVILKAIALVMALFVIVILAMCLLPKVSPVFNTMGTAAEGRLLPVYCVETEEKKIAISFDCAWGDEYSEKLLEILREKNVKATFFMTGQWVENFPETVKKIAEEGHELGNHSETHPQMTDLSADGCKSELLKAHEKVKELTGVEMTLFRPPYGAYNDTVIKAAGDLGYQTIQWDVDSLDWKDYGRESIINTVCNHAHLGNGSIILMHNGAKYTNEALAEMLDKIIAEGYEIVPVSELVMPGKYKVDYDCDHEGRQFKL